MNSKYFIIQEFVPPSIFKTFGESSIMFIDPKVIAIAEAYREFFKAPVIVNTWHKKGGFSERGFRIPSSKTGATYSQHKQGRAFDCNVIGVTPQEMFKTIVDNFEHFKQFGLTTLENITSTPTWIHSDCRWHDGDGLLIVDPM